MQTVVMAAGRGTRMSPLTDGRPKPMLPVADKPLVAHTVEAAAAAGAEPVVLVVGYESEDVRAYFGDEYAGVTVEYAEQRRRRGTADAVRTARARLHDGPFVVLSGDVLYDRASLMAFYDAADGGPCLGCAPVDDPRNYGVLQARGGTVEGVVEKPDDPPSNRVNVGAYAFPAAAQEWLEVTESERGEHELTDVLARVCREFDVQAVAFERWMDVGRPWELLEANEWKLAEQSPRRAGDVSEDADVDGVAVVEEGATVRKGVTIEGPVLVRAGATVGPNAYVRGATLLGRGATVGHAVEVKNSVLMRDATVGHLAYVGDSVLGRGTNLGAGTTIANLRHDEANVEVRVRGEPVDTGRRKFGAVLGDDARTGVDTAVNAGVKLESGATTMPGETVLADRERESADAPE